MFDIWQRISNSKAKYPLLIGMVCLFLVLISTQRSNNDAETVDEPAFRFSGVQLPTNFRDTLIHYAIIERRDGTIRDVYINPEAIVAVRTRGFLPDNTIMVIEGFYAQLDDEGQPLTDANGHFIKGEPLEMIHVAHQSSAWSAEDFVDDTRLANWNFGSFSAESLAPFEEPITPCFQCHTPHGGPFTLNALRAYARSSELQYVYCNQTGRSPCASMTN